jgi:hypothetical protein
MIHPPAWNTFPAWAFKKNTPWSWAKCSRHGEGFVPIRNVNMNKNLKKDFLTV